MIDRDCNICVYSTRNGGCRKGICNGTKTVKDIQADMLEKVVKELNESELVSFTEVIGFLKDKAERLREQDK